MNEYYKNLTIQLIKENILLTQIIIKNSNKINIPHSMNLNPTALLQTIAMKESTYGTNNKSRYESAYAPGGIYYRTDYVKKLFKKYGKRASCSYSAFQIMFITAYELGYQGIPEDLSYHDIAIEWVIKYINSRIMKFGPLNLEQIFDAYNSGSFRDRYIPKEYIRDSIEYYNFFNENYILFETISKEES